MTTKKPHRSACGSRSVFETTQWSVVIAAGDVPNRDSRAALARLCEVYWLPLYSYARRQIPNVDDAQESTQEFFAELLEKNYVASAARERGRFGAFLLTAFKHFLSKQWEKQRALKRGGGKLPISFDFAAAESSFNMEPASGLTSEQKYD